MIRLFGKPKPKPNTLTFTNISKVVPEETVPIPVTFASLSVEQIETFLYNDSNVVAICVPNTTGNSGFIVYVVYKKSLQIANNNLQYELSFDCISSTNSNANTCSDGNKKKKFVLVAKTQVETLEIVKKIQEPKTQVVLLKPNKNMQQYDVITHVIINMSQVMRHNECTKMLDFIENLFKCSGMIVSTYSVPTVEKNRYAYKNTVFTNTNASNNNAGEKVKLTQPKMLRNAKTNEKRELEYHQNRYTCEATNSNTSTNTNNANKIEVQLCLRSLLEINEYITKVGNQFILNIEKLLK